MNLDEASAKAVELTQDDRRPRNVHSILKDGQASYTVAPGRCDDYQPTGEIIWDDQDWERMLDGPSGLLEALQQAT